MEDLTSKDITEFGKMLIRTNQILTPYRSMRTGEIVTKSFIDTPFPKDFQEMYIKIIRIKSNVKTFIDAYNHRLDQIVSTRLSTDDDGRKRRARFYKIIRERFVVKEFSLEHNNGYECLKTLSLQVELINRKHGIRYYKWKNYKPTVLLVFRKGVMPEHMWPVINEVTRIRTRRRR